LLSRYSQEKDSLRQHDVLVLLETPFGVTTGLEFGVFGQTPQKMGSSARPCRPRLWSVANVPAPIFRPFDVRLAVSDVLRSTPTTLSVSVTHVSSWI